MQFSVASKGTEEVRQHHVQVQLIPYEYVKRILHVHFTVHFFGSLLHFLEVSSTSFCIVRKTLNFLYPFSEIYIHLGTRPLESRRQV